MRMNNGVMNELNDYTRDLLSEEREKERERESKKMQSDELGQMHFKRLFSLL